MVDPVSLGAITTGLIVKAVDRAEDDAQAGDAARPTVLVTDAAPLKNLHSAMKTFSSSERMRMSVWPLPLKASACVMPR